MRLQMAQLGREQGASQQDWNLTAFIPEQIRVQDKKLDRKTQTGMENQRKT